jgi:hypothetical protein
MTTKDEYRAATDAWLTAATDRIFTLNEEAKATDNVVLKQQLQEEAWQVAREQLAYMGAYGDNDHQETPYT